MTIDPCSPLARLAMSSTRDGVRVRVVATGEVDLSTADTLRATLTAAMQPGLSEVVVDLAGISFLDSTGIGALVEAHHEAVAHGTRIRVVDPQPPVQRVLEITGVMPLLTTGAG